MRTGTAKSILEINFPEGVIATVTQGNLCVTFSAAGVPLTINGRDYSLDETGLVFPANDQQAPNLAQSVLEVGQRLRDGTVVLSVDLDKNEVLFVPEMIFGGEAKFFSQDDVVKSVNGDALHGHSDWRRITDDEGDVLAANWFKVTTQDPICFWLASYASNFQGGMGRGGFSVRLSDSRYNSNPVPVIRSGPARVLDI